jgi:mannose-6-phosphate isomerase-like protein (cupin superfamily)
MSLLPEEDIGMEVHSVDQFIRIERGTGIAIINNVIYPLSDGDILNIPAGYYHNINNTGTTRLQLYTIYSPPNEPPGLIQVSKPT